MEQSHPTPNIPPVIQPVAPLVKKIQKFDFKKNAKLIGIAFLVVVIGVATGWLISGNKGKAASTGENAPGVKQTTTEAGMSDTSAFKDTAEGTLEEGGIGGEGTHHLVREGGVSQTVYLTSTVIDLQSFVGKKVKIWGQTISGKKAGWLMDVGKIKVSE